MVVGSGSLEGMMKQLLSLLLLGLGAVSAVRAKAEPVLIPGVGPAGPVVRLHTGFKFTEGPATSGGEVYFSDIPSNRIHRIDPKGELSTFLEESAAANGLMFDAGGRLLVCQGQAKRLSAIDVRTRQITSLAEKWDNQELGTPNDLVIDRQGGKYFTTPDTGSVYHVDVRGRVVRLLEKQPRPNGVILSPDEKTLYVVPSGSSEVMAYPVQAPGKIGAGKVFCTLLPNPKQPGRPGGDGVAVDSRGNLYLVRPSMKLIQVVGPDGKALGLIHLPEEPSNCKFGGADLRTLYVTAQTSVYSIKMVATGHRFAETPSGPLPEDWDYGPSMRKVAARFRGREGVVIHVGGSMTIANPYGTWARSGKGKTSDDRAILQWMHTEQKNSTDGWWLCRTEVEHYRAYTAESGLKSAMLFAGGRRGLPTLDKLLDEYRPRLVTLECGIYDVEDGVPLEEYRKNLGKALDQILERGAIPILNTIPPFKARLERTQQFNETLRALARDRGVPVLDLEREILVRRPDDWFGTLANRIHLTASEAGAGPGAEPTPENLRRSGYLLRGWLTVRKIAEVKQRVIDAAISPD
jgi:gluconolactonase